LVGRVERRVSVQRSKKNGKPALRRQGQSTRPLRIACNPASHSLDCTPPATSYTHGCRRPPSLLGRAAAARPGGARALKGASMIGRDDEETPPGSLPRGPHPANPLTSMHRSIFERTDPRYGAVAIPESRGQSPTLAQNVFEGTCLRDRALRRYLRVLSDSL